MVKNNYNDIKVDDTNKMGNYLISSCNTLPRS